VLVQRPSPSRLRTLRLEGLLLSACAQALHSSGERLGQLVATLCPIACTAADLGCRDRRGHRSHEPHPDRQIRPRSRRGVAQPQDHSPELSHDLPDPAMAIAHGREQALGPLARGALGVQAPANLDRPALEIR
jgi:hypothetical protein